MTNSVNTSDAFKYHWNCWKLFGLKPPQIFGWKLLYIIYAVALNLSVTFLFPLSFLINLCLSRNLGELCENTYMTLTDVLCSLKFLNVFIVRHKLIKVRKVFDDLDIETKNEDEIEVLSEGLKAAHNCFYRMGLVYFVAVMASQPLVFVSAEKILMYPAWLPLDWKNSNRDFVIAHLYQTFCLFVQGTQLLTTDTFPPAYLCILSAHVRALALRICKLGRNDKGFNNLEEQQENYHKLTQCIADHQKILGLYATIQDIVSTACLVQFVCTALSQCAIGIYILYIGIDYTKLFHTSTFFFSLTLQIFILCYYGDRLCQESEFLTECIYSCNWMDQSEEFKSTLLVLLHRSQTPNVIMAGGLIPVRLPTFVQVMKTTYSAFTVLNEAKNS